MKGFMQWIQLKLKKKKTPVLKNYDFIGCILIIRVCNVTGGQK